MKKQLKNLEYIPVNKNYSQQVCIYFIYLRLIIKNKQKSSHKKYFSKEYWIKCPIILSIKSRGIFALIFCFIVRNL